MHNAEFQTTECDVIPHICKFSLHLFRFNAILAFERNTSYMSWYVYALNKYIFPRKWLLANYPHVSIYRDGSSMIQETRISDTLDDNLVLEDDW